MADTEFSAIKGYFQTGTSNPSNPVVGETYYDTANNRLMTYDGTQWVGFAFTTSTSTSSTTSTSITTSTSRSTSSSTSISTSTTTTSTSLTTSTSTS